VILFIIPFIPLIATLSISSPIANISPKISSSSSSSYNLAINSTWNATDIDVANDIAVDSDGNIYITGYYGIITGTGPSDAFIAKFDKNGNHLWNYTWDSSQIDEAEAIALDTAGNIYIAGYNKSIIPSTTTAFIAKLDSNGNSLKNISLALTSYTFANDIVLDEEDNIYITGTNQSISLGQTDAFIAKFNTSMDLKKTIHLDISPYDYSYAIELDGDDNCYIAGSNGTTLLGPSDAFVAKFNSTGSSEMIISHQFRSSDSSASGIALKSSGDIYIVGYNGSILSDIDAFMAKYDSEGNSQFNITNYFPTDNSTANDIDIDNCGNFYVAGWNGSLNSLTDAFIAKFDNDGNSLMNITHHFSASNSSAEALTLDNGGNIYITGYNGSLVSSRDAFIAKYSAPTSPLPFFILMLMAPSEGRIPGYPILPTSVLAFMGGIIIIFLFRRKFRLNLD
jgi:uncharacterized delta-60 repeat protein